MNTEGRGVFLQCKKATQDHWKLASHRNKDLHHASAHDLDGINYLSKGLLSESL